MAFRPRPPTFSPQHRVLGAHQHRVLGAHQHRVLGALLGAFGIMATTGCPEDDAGLDSADFAADELAARCDFLVRCGFAPDRDTCRNAQEIDRGVVQAVGGIELDRVGYDEDAAEEYIAVLQDATCDSTLANARLLEEARRAVFDGEVARGDECFADDECAGDAICERFGCDGSQVCCTGTCVGLEILSAGSSCPLTSDGPRITQRCDDTAYCAAPPDDGMDGEPPATGTCAPRVDNGMPCDVNAQCFDAQRCDTGDSGTCYRLSAAGEMCNAIIQGGSCIGINQICDMGSSTCVDAPGPGAPCIFGQCQPYAICQEDLCVARPTLNEFCDGSIPCLGDLDCRDEFCQRNEVVFVCVEGQPPPPPTEDE